jgi:pilus assembly protein CpaE
MVAEVSAGHKVNETFRSVGMQVTGRTSVEAGTRAGGIRLPDLFRMRKRA